MNTPPLSFRVATCQFPVSEDVERNVRHIERLSRHASEEKAAIILFPEASLTRWCTRPEHVARLERERLEVALSRITAFAKEHGIYIAIGAYHFARDSSGMTNSVYLINPEGRIQSRYDKRKLIGKENNICSAGKKALTVVLHGHKCGFLICFDSCFPELHRAYQEQGVTILFHAFRSADDDRGPNTLAELTMAQLRTRAADHGVWIVASNSSGRYSNLPASVFRPDGTVVSMKRHVTGILIHDFPDKQLGWMYVPPRQWPTAPFTLSTSRMC